MPFRPAPNRTAHSPAPDPGPATARFGRRVLLLLGILILVAIAALPPGYALYRRWSGAAPDAAASQAESRPAEPPVASWGPAYQQEATAEELLAEAECVARQVVTVHPNQPEALAVLARLHQARGESQPAVELWEKCVTLQPAFTDGHLGIGAVALRRGDLATAVGALERAAALAPLDPRVPTALAAAWLGQGRVDDAVAVLEKAAQRAPLSVEASIILGQAYLQQEKYELAVELFDKLRRQAPREPKTLYGWARACLQVGRADEAEQAMQKFRESQERRVEDELDTAHAFSDAATARGILVQTLWGAAAVHAQAGNADRAARCWRGVAHLEPTHVAARELLLRMYQKADRNREAAGVAEQLCALEPDEADHWFDLAVLRGCLHEYAAALTAVDRALRLAPDNARFREARELLRKEHGT